MKITVEIREFNELFMDLIPWTDNFNEARLIQSLVDDLNGILNITVDIAESKPVRYEKISNTMDYLCTDASSTSHISQAGLHSMKLAVVSALQLMFKELSRIYNWANCRYRVVSHSFRPARSREDLNIMLDSVVCFDYPKHIQNKLIESAELVLESFCEWDNRRHS